MSCASPSLCVATGFRGLVMSTAPASGAQSWKPVTAPVQMTPCTPPPNLPPGVTFQCPPSGIPIGPLATFSPQAISCPASTLCVAAGLDGQARRSAVLISTNPAGGASTWTETQFADSIGFSAVSCNTTPVCVALNYKGRVLATANPTGGASAWKAQDLYPYHPSGGVSCVPGMCALESYERAAGSYMLTTSNPLGGVGSWNGSQVSPGTNLAVVACASRHRCVAADAFGAIYASRNPANPSGRWMVDPSTYPRGNPFARGFNAFPSSASCSAAGLCAVGEGSFVLTSTNPFGNHRWHKTKIDSTQFALSCPTNQLCVAADRTGRILTGTG
ncbi:MAG: hypothetical protein QOJ25_581 [Solirubrobacteraceae bacterium]|nr:hypothetical protein [Solirubrobacteraceae bacterium]